MAASYSKETVCLGLLQTLNGALDAFDSKRATFNDAKRSPDRDGLRVAQEMADWVVDRGRRAQEAMEYFWAHQSMYSQGGTLQYIHILHQRFGRDAGDELEAFGSLEAFWETELREVTLQTRILQAHRLSIP
jgi:hypothetical protein